MRSVKSSEATLNEEGKECEMIERSNNPDPEALIGMNVRSLLWRSPRIGGNGVLNEIEKHNSG